MDYAKLMPIAIEAASFISAFAAIAASIIMIRLIRKFVTGILASGFKTIGIGIFVIALAIITDAVNSYLQISQSEGFYFLMLIEQIFFIVGTYIIVIGCKTMGDKLEMLSKQNST